MVPVRFMESSPTTIWHCVALTIVCVTVEVFTMLPINMNGLVQSSELYDTQHCTIIHTVACHVYTVWKVFVVMFLKVASSGPESKRVVE